MSHAVDRSSTDSTRAWRPRLRHLGFLSGALIATLLLAACGTVTAPAGSTDAVQLLVSPQASSSQTTSLDGASVSGSVVVVAKGGKDVQSVSFYIDNTLKVGSPTYSSTSAPFKMPLNTIGLPNGPHTVTAVADVPGGAPEQTTGHFVVSNGSSGAGSVSFRTIPPATLYVDPTSGSDSNGGRSPTDAFRTVQHAADVVQPGDVVYLRGGTYPVQVAFTRSGTASQPIYWTSYPGEWAVFDGSGLTPVVDVKRVLLNNVSYNVFANFEVRHSPQEAILVQNGGHNIFSNLWTDGNEFSGFTNLGSSYNRYEYIVSFNNYDVNDPYGPDGDNADGLSLSSGDGNVVYASLFFNNGDDGVDAWKSTNTVIEHTISHDNGRGPGGNGNGFKAGGPGGDNAIVRNSIAFNNRGAGFDDNTGQNVHFYNDTAYNNGTYPFVAGSTTILRNNIAYGGNAPGLWGADSAYNTWDLGISNPQFASTDPSQSGFLSLGSGSAAIGAGTDVGLPYSGSAPDLGAMPYQSVYADLISPLSVPIDALVVASPVAPTTLGATASR